MNLASRTIRALVKTGAPATALIVDNSTSKAAEIYRGNAASFQFLFTAQGGEVIDLSTVTSLTHRIMTAQKATGSSVLATKTVALANLTAAPTLSNWNAGTAQHVSFSYSNAELNLDPAGVRKVLWHVVTALLSDGTSRTLCGDELVLVEDNDAAADPPAENPGTAITLEEADARYALATDLQPITQTGMIASVVIAGTTYYFPISTTNPNAL